MKIVIILVTLLVVVFAQGPQGPPPFLAGAPQQVINEFGQLLRGAPDKTDAQIDRDIEQWVSRQGGKVKAEYEKFKAQLRQGKARADAAHRASIAKFSPAARAADAQLTAIAENPNLIGREKEQKITAILNSLPANVKAEIQREMQG
ncbi:unnamed protein product [Toxocara canis]|uniref:DUF148 domain-containing protein n=1 Tax=Toxocara canis TaxID=6265 RepID=A0A183UTX0_TOXCA|nr:unnamed protein product [Toxocara canis]